MNVTDVMGNKNVEGDKFIQMIEQQKALMEKYHHIERNFRLTTDCPIDLNDPKGQLLLKDFAWRATEEIAEALSALLEEGYQDATVKGAILHAQEEIADAFHFILEFFILAGGENNVHFYCEKEGDALDNLFASFEPSENYSIEIEALDFIRQLGMVCHTLKNKPWKQSHMLTDTNTFWDRMMALLKQFCKMSLSVGMGSNELFQMYFRKAAVNEFRQRSNY